MLSSRRHHSPRTYALYVFVSLIVATTVLTLVYFSFTMQQPATSTPVPRVILISTTYYNSLSDSRYLLALQTVRAARTHNVPYLIVDGSPSSDIAAALQKEGAAVIREDVQAMGGKGKGFAYRYGIREAMARSSSLFPAAAGEYVICISEPEKVDIVRFLPQLSAILLPAPSAAPAAPNILIPARSTGGFASLPSEQRHSELFANSHLRNFARQSDPPLPYTTQPPDSPLDLLFGPVLFHASVAHYWLASTSPLWDAQIAPYIEAAYSGEGRVIGVEVEYRHPAEQTGEEEGRVEWSGKRYMQLNVVVPALERALKEGAERAKKKAAAGGGAS